MKINRFIPSLLVLFAISPSTSARDSIHSEDDNLSSPSSKYGISIGTGLKSNYYFSLPAERFGVSGPKQMYYEDSREDKYANIILGFTYDLKNKWTFCFDADCIYINYKYHDPFTLDVIESGKSFGIGLYCGIRYNWVNKTKWRLYSQLSGGIMLHDRSSFWEREIGRIIDDTNSFCNWVYQPTMIGLSYGKHINIIYNVGMFGHMNIGSISLGYKF